MNIKSVNEIKRILPHAKVRIQTVKTGISAIAVEDFIALKVPSVCDENSFNYLLNPQHPEYKLKVKIVKETPFTP